MDTPLTWHAPTPGLVMMMNNNAHERPSAAPAPLFSAGSTTTPSNSAAAAAAAFASPFFAGAFSNGHSRSNIQNVNDPAQSTPFVYCKTAAADDEEERQQQQLNHLWRRTRSLDDGSSYQGEECANADGGDDHRGADAPLHSSFDASLLGDHQGDDHAQFRSIFRSAGKPKRRATHDYDGDEEDGDDEAACTALFGPVDDVDHDNNSDVHVGRKHLRQQPSASCNNKQQPLEEQDCCICPGTVRKLARHNTNETAVGSKTPVRLLWGSKQPPTPASAVKKRRTPNNNKRTMPPTTPLAATLCSSSFLRRPQEPFPTGSNRSHKNALTPPRPPVTKTIKTTTATIPSSSTHSAALYTGTTAASSSAAVPLSTSRGLHIWETSHDDSSSPSSTPFRFTSFPASLPRVNNPRVSNASDTVRKRMSFGGQDDIMTPPLNPSLHEAATFLHANNNHHATTATTNNTPFVFHNNNSLNQSREEDSGTQNTSISSLSTHGGGGVPVDASGHLLQHAGMDHPVHTRLFQEQEYNYSDDDEDDGDDEEDAVVREDGLNDGDGVGRTRLDFNLVLCGGRDGGNKKTGAKNNPAGSHVLEKDKRGGGEDMPLDTIDSNADLLRPYEPRHVNSFPSTSSSHSPLRNLSGCETASTAALTPSGGHCRDNHQIFSNVGAVGGGGRPGTPRDVQLHFQLDTAQCSPIPGIPEEEELNSSVQSRRSGLARLPPKTRPMEDVDTGKGGLPPKKPSEFSFSLDTASVSSTSSGKTRRLRPMPDMSAFDSGALSSSRNERSKSDDSANSDSGSKPKRSSSPKLMCPPTPVRTPAWAHSGDEEGGGLFHRSNSLIANRVLATCSPPPFHPVGDEGAQLVGEAMEDAEMTNADSAVPDAPMFQSGGVVDMNDPNQMFEPLPPPRIMPRFGSDKVGAEIAFATHFESLGVLGKGAFADVFKVRSKTDKRLYAVKRNRRRFRGKRDRDNALAEVRSMQRLQHIDVNGRSSSKKNYLQYLLYFFRAWQEDGHFFCQTELCCRDTCRELMDSLRSQWNISKTKYPSLLQKLPRPYNVVPGSHLDLEGRLVPEMTVWKICHDTCAGLSHMHARGLVHNDIKPSNIFFVPHGQLGAQCKIGDFGMAGAIGTSEDGQEGDSQYMAPELLSSAVKHSSADIFSLGLTLYELASNLHFELPKQGPRWHELRCGSHVPEVPESRDPELKQLLQGMIFPDPNMRPTADAIVKHNKVHLASSSCDEFLRDYIRDIEDFDRCEEERKAALEQLDDKTPRHGSGPPCRVRVCSPTLDVPTVAPNIFTPEA